MDQVFRDAFGAALQELRESNDLTQEQLEGLTDVHRTRISSWERGQTLPSIENLRRIAAGLDVTAADVLDLAEGNLAKKVKRTRRKPGRPARNPAAS